MRKKGSDRIEVYCRSSLSGFHPPPLRSIAPACLCLLVVAALIASPLFAQAQASDTTPAATQDLRQTALSFRAQQDYDKAIECYTALLAQNPTDVLSIKVDLGLCYKAKKDYSNAMPLFTEVAASQDGRKAWAMFYIEDCYCEQGKIADAVAELTKAYTECPEARADVLLRRAARQCDIQKYKEALADYEEFLAKYPDKKELIATFSARLPEISNPVHITASCGGDTASIDVTVVGISGEITGPDTVAVDEEATFSAQSDPTGHESLIEWSTGQTGGSTTTSWSDTGTKKIVATVGSQSISKDVLVVDQDGSISGPEIVAHGAEAVYSLVTNPNSHMSVYATLLSLTRLHRGNIALVPAVLLWIELKNYETE